MSVARDQTPAQSARATSPSHPYVVHSFLCRVLRACSSGKLAGSDKRAAKEITHAVDSQLSHSAVQQHASLANSQTPLGDLHEPSTKQLLVSLITTLNASFPDYDFRSGQRGNAREWSAGFTVRNARVDFAAACLLSGLFGCLLQQSSSRAIST